MRINKTRGLLYRIARYLGDYQAISSGNPKRMAKRVGRKMVGKGFGKFMGKLFK